MSKAGPLSSKKRKLEDGMRGKVARPYKRKRKQQEYHSSSENDEASDDGFAPVSLDDTDDENAQPSKPTGVKTVQKSEISEGSDKDVASSEDGEDEKGTGESEDDDTDLSEDGQRQRRKPSKRNDPEAFSTSMSKILSTKLSQSARKDPVLSRSREAVETSMSIANERLEHRVRAKIRAERKEDLQRGRITDVLGVSAGQTGEVAEEEKRLRKTAQRGVVKLFNAVRAAQVRGEQALKEEKRKGTVGLANKEEKRNEMSKQGFLELISGKGQPTEAT